MTPGSNEKEGTSITASINIAFYIRLVSAGDLGRGLSKHGGPCTC